MLAVESNASESLPTANVVTLGNLPTTCHLFRGIWRALPFTQVNSYACRPWVSPTYLLFTEKHALQAVIRIRGLPSWPQKAKYHLTLPCSWNWWHSIESPDPLWRPISKVRDAWIEGEIGNFKLVANSAEMRLSRKFRKTGKFIGWSHCEQTSFMKF